MFDLSDADIDVLRDTFRRLAAEPELTGMMFYDRLFAMAPELRSMFPADLEQQAVKLMSMLGAVVARIHDHGALTPLVSDLGRRHAGYGVQPAHYELVGEALLWALGQRIGPDFQRDAYETWRRTYVALAEVMLDAAAAPPPAG
jgi:nitric oxide dioxygenase